MDQKQLNEILNEHKKWRIGDPKGKRADLQDADLRDAYLRNADLRYADLRYADLWYADLRNADLRYADLWYADLQDADLQNADLRYADLQDADLQNADLRYADLRYADLRNADLWYADLQDADLQDADLQNADLQDANLQDADLRYANLRNAKGNWMHFRSNLNLLKYQKGKLRAFKYLDGDKSPYQNATYEVGKTYSVDDYNTDIFKQCAKGLNVASLEWCLQDTNFNLDKTYIEVEFDVKDIICIPFASDGKFRVKKFKVLRKLTKKEIKKEYKVIK